MSLFRCPICDRTLDSDYIEMYKMDDLDVCLDCYVKAMDKMELEK